LWERYTEAGPDWGNNLINLMVMWYLFIKKALQLAADVLKARR
jgi:hypothetical protein